MADLRFGVTVMFIVAYGVSRHWSWSMSWLWTWGKQTHERQWAMDVALADPGDGVPGCHFLS